MGVADEKIDKSGYHHACRNVPDQRTEPRLLWRGSDWIYVAMSAESRSRPKGIGRKGQSRVGRAGRHICRYYRYRKSRERKERKIAQRKE